MNILNHPQVTNIINIYICIYTPNHDDPGCRVLCGSRLGRTKEVVPPVPAPPTVDTVSSMGRTTKHLWDIMGFWVNYNHSLT